MDITLTILFYFLVLIIFITLVYIYNVDKKQKNISKDNIPLIAPLLSGSIEDCPQKDSYPIVDFNGSRIYKINGKILSNINDFVKFVNWGKSLSPLGLECGDGVFALKFTPAQKKDIKSGNLIKEDDIIIINKKNNNRIIQKSRRFISSINLSLSINELLDFARNVAPKDENLDENLRVNENTIRNLKTKLLSNDNIIDYFKRLKESEGTKEYKELASNFILSITYKEDKNNEKKMYADYSIHEIEDLYGKIEHVISHKYIDSEGVKNEFNSRKKKSA